MFEGKPSIKYVLRLKARAVIFAEKAKACKQTFSGSP